VAAWLLALLLGAPVPAGGMPLCLGCRPVLLLLLSTAPPAVSAAPPVPTAAAAAPLSYSVSGSGDYTVLVDGVPWFESDDIFLHADGRRFSLRDGSLALERVINSTGTDGLGAYSKATMVLHAAAATPAPVTVEFSIKCWGNGETLEFTQAFPGGLPASASPDPDAKNGVATSFPSWRPADLSSGVERGWMAYDGWDCGSDGGASGCMKQQVAPAGHVAYGVWGNSTKQLPGGLEGSGPMAIFAADLSRAVVVSAFTNTMAQSQVFAHDAPPPSPAGRKPALNFTEHPGTYCVGNNPVWHSNNISLSGCRAQATRLAYQGLADGFDYSAVPGSPTGTCGGVANCAMCRVGEVGVVKATTQHYSCWELPAAPATPGVLRYGLLGSVTEVPPGWSSSVILSLGARGGGPAAAVRTWGAKLLRFYGKEPQLSRADFISRHLGFDTDNGAFYYYNPEKNKTYAQTLLDVHSYSQRVGLPYRHVQIDSWW
jgi:hypothetical protein